MDLSRVYIHYPFCVKLCHYCNFTAGVAPSNDFKDLYFKALLKEISSYQTKYDFSTIASKSLYLGGGTPSLMPFPHLEKLFSIFNPSKNAEITLEINPETVTKEKAEFWHNLGINRVSLGWQSMNDSTLKFLGRTSTSNDNIRAFDILRTVGFQNISVDRILSVSGDEDNSFFEAIKSCNPDHISSYQLSIEDKTVLSLWSKQKKYIPLPDKIAIQKESVTANILKDLGFERYETSNYTKTDKQGQHNLGYWNYENWLGVGAGASGFLPNNLHGFHYTNQSHFWKYCENPLAYQEQETPSMQTAIKEFLMLGIRKREGISKKRLKELFKISWEDLFPNPSNQDFFIETEEMLILKENMIPLTNPSILQLWQDMNQKLFKND